MFCAALSSRPQLIIGGCTPRPRNDRKLSIRMIDGISSVVATTTWLITLGRMWRTTMRQRLAPTASAAET